MAERQLPKLNVAGSIPVSRSNNFEIKAKKNGAEARSLSAIFNWQYLRLATC